MLGFPPPLNCFKHGLYAKYLGSGAGSGWYLACVNIAQIESKHLT